MLGGLAALAFAAAGSSLAASSGVVRVLVMGFSMAVPMVAWMSYRGPGGARNAEMAGSLVVPSLAAAGLAAGGILSAGGALALQHAVRIPAMLGVMLWRYDHYAHPETLGGRNLGGDPRVFPHCPGASGVVASGHVHELESQRP